MKDESLALKRSRRIKQALDLEYNNYLQDTKKKSDDASLKLVSKSVETKKNHGTN